MTFARQILGKLGADARRRRVGVDAVLDHPKSLAGLEILVFGTDRRGVHEREAGFIGLQGRAKQITPVEAGGEQSERGGGLGPG